MDVEGFASLLFVAPMEVAVGTAVQTGMKSSILVLCQMEHPHQGCSHWKSRLPSIRFSLGEGPSLSAKL